MSSAGLKRTRVIRPVDPPFLPIGHDQGDQALPRYEQVKQRLSERIVRGQWEPGYVLPAENDLADLLTVSVGTVRRALADLTKEGLVVRHPRTGTVVTGRSPHHTLRHFYQYFRLHDEKGGLAHSNVKILSVHLEQANDTERRELRLAMQNSPDTEVVRIKRLRLIGDQTVMWDLMAIPAALVPGFPTNADEIPSLIYHHLLDVHGIRIAGVRENLTAEPANDEDRQCLTFATPSGPAAVLVIEEVAFGPQDVPIVYAMHRATTEQFKYVNEVR